MKKYIPTPEEYLATHTGDEFEEYLDKYPEGWNLYIAPSIKKNLEDEHWSIGSPLIGAHKENGEILFRYRNNRIEKESINEIQIICRVDIKKYYKKDIWKNFEDEEYFLTGYLPLIFHKYQKVYVVEYTNQDCMYESQYGILTHIFDRMIANEIEKTFIGHNFIVQIEGVDRSKIPTFDEYFKSKSKT